MLADPAMVTVIRLRAHGGPQELKAETMSPGRPGPGELLVRQTAIGVNFHDVYVRNGSYRTLALPGIPGIEAVGVVDAVGAGVSGISAGDRIGYVTGAYGAYADQRLLPAELAIPLPAALGDTEAASILLKGLTADMLIRRVGRVEAGMTVLVHAAAGGVGRLLVQWLTALGIRVIGTVGSSRKEDVARRAGCADIVRYRDVDFVGAVLDLTGGRGVDVAFDAVGKDTFFGSIETLASFGQLVNFGQASGPVPPFEISRLAARSNSVSRPILFHFIAERKMRDEMAHHLFAALAGGLFTPGPVETFPLADAAAAHARLESRDAEGTLLLVPEHENAE